LEKKEILPITPDKFLEVTLGEYLKYIRFYPKTGEYFIYDTTQGIYNIISPAEFSSHIMNLIMTCPLKEYVDPIKYTDKVVQLLRGTDATYGGLPEID